MSKKSRPDKKGWWIYRDNIQLNAAYVDDDLEIHAFFVSFDFCDDEYLSIDEFNKEALVEEWIGPLDVLGLE